MIVRSSSHIVCVPLLFLLILFLQVSCAVSPKKVIYTSAEFEAEVLRLLDGDGAPVQVRCQTFLDSARDPYVFDVNPSSPPFLLDAQAREQLLDCVGFSGSEPVRLMQLRECVINRPTRIDYNGTLTLDATGCLELREGNCFALTNLFIGAAREAGLRAYYVMVEDVITNRSAGAQVYHTNHIVSEVIINSGHRTVDFIPDPRDYRVRTTLSDIEAAGLYCNNLGATLMIDGDLEGAGRLLAAAERLFPDSYQVQNNLGLLYRRQGDLEAAQSAFENAFALARFPDLIMGNLLSLYQETGQAHRVEDMRQQLSRISRRNPYLYIALARESLEEEDYQQALDYLTTARKINRRIPTIYAMESEIWEILENPRRLERAQKKLARLLQLEGEAGNAGMAEGAMPAVQG